MRLNLGCGERKKDGYVNVDLCGNPDQRVDLSVFPWPWENDSCDEVYSEHFLEHVADYEKTVLEMHRILKPNGVLHFKVPHHRSPFAQWHLHLQNFSTYTCDILCGNVPYQWDNRRLFNKITASGGSNGLMVESATPPMFDTFTVNATAGAFDLIPRVAGTIVDIPGSIVVNHSGDGNCYVYGPTNNVEYGLAVKLTGTFGRIGIGHTATRSATLELKDGSNVTVKNLYTGDWGGSPARGRLIIDNGATVTVTENIRNGHWSGTPFWFGFCRSNLHDCQL